MCRIFRVTESSVCNCVHALARMSDALGSPDPAVFCALTKTAATSPVHDAVSVQSHEVHLAAAS